MPLEFGIYLPDNGPLATPDSIAAIAHRGEDAGIDILALSDHVLIPKRRSDSVYPYSEDGQWPLGNDCLELLSALGYLAGITNKARLLTSVMVLPHRPPVFTAKALATIDVLSKGRLIAGVGVGWLAEEFEAIGAPPFKERGHSSDEYLQVFKQLWTADDPRHEGRYARFCDIHFLPKPVQRPHPPVWIGGESAPALRRTAKFGDVWYPISNNPRSPLGGVEQYAAAVRRLHKEAAKLDRKPEEIGLAFNPAVYDITRTHKDPNGNRTVFTGTPADVVDDTRRYADLGVQSFVFSLTGESTEEVCREVSVLADKIIAPLR